MLLVAYRTPSRPFLSLNFASTFSSLPFSNCKETKDLCLGLQYCTTTEIQTLFNIMAEMGFQSHSIDNPHHSTCWCYTYRSEDRVFGVCLSFTPGLSIFKQQNQQFEHCVSNDVIKRPQRQQCAGSSADFPLWSSRQELLRSPEADSKFGTKGYWGAFLFETTKRVNITFNHQNPWRAISFDWTWIILIEEWSQACWIG